MLQDGRRVRLVVQTKKIKQNAKKMITEGKYRHTYTATASDITPLYKLTPNAMLMYFQDSFARLMTIYNVAAFDIVKQHRMWVMSSSTGCMRPILMKL